MPKISVKYSFLVFNALVFMFRETDLICGFYIACIIHEIGHIAAIRLTGGKVGRIDLSCFGIKMTATPPVSLRAGIIVQLSGPFANLLVFFILAAAKNIGYTAVFCLAEGIFNLLPYKFLDGGAVLETIADGTENETLYHILITVLRIFITVLIICIGFLIFI